MRTDLSCPMRGALSESGEIGDQSEGRDALAENRNRPTRAGAGESGEDWVPLAIRDQGEDDL